jgi:COMPASS component SPP1
MQGGVRQGGAEYIQVSRSSSTTDARFCSSKCAFAHARTLLASVEKKDAKALESALSAYPSPAPSVTDPAGEKERQVLEGAQDAATLALLSSLRRQSADAERALAILARRQAMLAAAVGVWESLAPGAVEEPKKRSKNKKRDGEKDPRPCGYDPRLVWSDAQVAGWDGSEREMTPPKEEAGEGEGEEGDGEARKETALERAARLGLCAVGRRCERHAGWQKTLAVQLEVEATQLTRRRDELAVLGERIERVGTTTVAARRAREGLHAALAAKKK